MSYDLKRPHQVVVSKGNPPLILQDGHAWERNSRKHVGKITDVVRARVIGKHDYKLCELCGGSFTNPQSFEEHLYNRHIDVLVQRVSTQHAPKGIKGVWTPTDDMLREEATNMANEAIQAEDEVQTPGDPNKDLNSQRRTEEPKPKVWRSKR